MYGEGSATDEHDQNLPTNDDELNADEPVVFEHAFENVETIIKTSGVPLIEDLHPYKGVEDCALKSVLLSSSLVAKDTGSCKVKNKCDCQLIY